MAARTRPGSRSPRSTRAPARPAGPGAAPRRRAARRRDSRALRLDRARPSGSRTVGHPTISTGKRQVGRPCGGPRPAAGSPSRRSRPGTGPTGRTAWPPPWPPRRSARVATRPRARRSRRRRAPSTPCGAGSRAVHLLAPAGRTPRRRPPARARRDVGVEVAGVGGEVGGVVELQRVDEDRHRHDVALAPRPASISDRCPACSAPMVGTRPTLRPRARSVSSASENSAPRSRRAWPARRARRPTGAPAPGAARRGARDRRTAAGLVGRSGGRTPVAGPGPRRRRSRAISSASRARAVPLEGGLVAAGGRAGERGGRAELGHVGQRGAGQAHEGVEVRARPTPPPARPGR